MVVTDASLQRNANVFSAAAAGSPEAAVIVGDIDAGMNDSRAKTKREVHSWRGSPIGIAFTFCQGTQNRACQIRNPQRQPFRASLTINS